jgi:hypothetical protein
VLRGGSWLRDVSHCRSAARYRNTPASRNADNGFRVLAAAEDVAAPPKTPPGPGTALAPVVPLPPREEEKAAEPFAPSLPAPEVSEPSFWSLVTGPCCCGTVVVGGLVVVLVMGLRGLMRRSRTYEDAAVVRTPPRRPGPRVAADGFWLDDPNLTPGSTVRYRCQVDGDERTGEFTVAPGPQGQFVYTGGVPSLVEILEVLPSGGPPGLGLVQPDLPPMPPPPRPSPPPFTGYPSAY